MAFIKINFPKYTGKDVPVLVSTMLPLAVLINYFLFGKRYFTEGKVFVLATLLTFAIFAGAFMVYGMVAISLRNRLPEDWQTPKRLTMAIALFLLMSAVLLSVLFRGYEWVGFLGYEFKEADFRKAFISLGIMNVFLTFLNEGIAKFERYRITVTETEQLKKEYMQSQLLGLKSQVNPHFLFNSLNNLSSLISEDAGRAEEFLDQMSRVYRYLLRHNEEHLITLETEVNFIESYFYLLKSRHGEGLFLSIMVHPDDAQQLMLPPLTLQIIFENIIHHNTIDKDDPLTIAIDVKRAWLEIRHSVHEKFITDADFDETGLENIINKFRLLCQQEVRMETKEKERIIRLPLIPVNETSLV
jgi:sensor histidine kinase YesM